MPTLQERVENNIGVITETSLLLAALNEGLHNLFAIIPYDRAMQFAQKRTAANANDGALVSGRVTQVIVSQRKATEIPVHLSNEVKNSSSIHVANALFPRFWRAENKIYGHPNDAMEVYEIAAPEVAVSDTDSVVQASLPDGGLEVGIFYACWQILLHRHLNATLVSIGNMPSAPTPPIAPSFDYTPAVAGNIGSITIDTLPLAPQFTPVTGFDELVAMTEGDIGVALDQTNLSDQYSALLKLIENEEDPELASQKIQSVNSMINALRGALDDEMATFQANNADYQREVDRVLAQARIDQERVAQQAQLDTNVSLQNELQSVQSAIAGYTAEVQAYQAQVGSYQTDVTSIVQAYQGVLSQHQQEQANRIAQIDNYKELYTQKLQLIATSNDGTTANRAGN